MASSFSRLLHDPLQEELSRPAPVCATVFIPPLRNIRDEPLHGASQAARFAYAAQQKLSDAGKSPENAANWAQMDDLRRAVRDSRSVEDLRLLRRDFARHNHPDVTGGLTGAGGPSHGRLMRDANALIDDAIRNLAKR